MGALRTKTSFRVDFHTFDNGLLVASADGKNDLMRVQTQKALNLGSGGWVVALKASTQDWLAVLRDSDYVVIQGRVNNVEAPVMVGRVDSVSWMEGVGGSGASTDQFVVTGRDLAGVVEDTQVWFNDFSEFGNNAGGKDMKNILGFIPGGSPNQVVTRLFDGMLGNVTPEGFLGGHWEVPLSLAKRIQDEDFTRAVENEYLSDLNLTRDLFNRKIYFSDFVDTETFVDNLRGIHLNEGVYMPGSAGMSLTQQLMEWQNEPLNELFMDVRSGRAASGRKVDPREGMGIGNSYALVMREKPFPNLLQGKDSRWFRLPMFSVPRPSIMSIDAIRGGQERINHSMIFETTSPLTPREQYAGSAPDFNRDSIKRHGLKRFEQRTKFVAGDANSQEPLEEAFWLEESKRWQALMTHWYALNHEYLSGTLELKRLAPWARVGHRVRFRRERSRKDITGYIETVAHQWAANTSGSTTIGYTRGFEGTDDEQLLALQTEINKYDLASSNLADLLDGFDKDYSKNHQDIGADEIEASAGLSRGGPNE